MSPPGGRLDENGAGAWGHELLDGLDRQAVGRALANSTCPSGALACWWAPLAVLGAGRRRARPERG